MLQRGLMNIQTKEKFIGRHFGIRCIGSFFYQLAKPPQGTVLFINLLGKELTPRPLYMEAPTNGLL